MANLLDFFHHPDTLDAVIAVSRFVACSALGLISGSFTVEAIKSRSRGQ